MEKLRIGIIGTGWIAHSHILPYLKLQEEGVVEVTALCDVDEAKAKAFAQQYHLKLNCYCNHRQMLRCEKLDAVSVCTYNMMHAECTVDCLEANVHVLLEKPLCVTFDEINRIHRAANSSGKILCVGFQERYDPNVMKIREIVESGALGTIYYVQTGGGRFHNIPTPYGTTFIDRNTGGFGAVGDIGCYALDVVLYTLGYPKPLTISGYTSDYFGKMPSYYEDENKPVAYAQIFGVDDFASAFIRLENNIVLDFRISWAMNLDSPCDTIIMGTKASLRIPASESWSRGIGGALKLYRNNHGLLETNQYPFIPTVGTETLFFLKIKDFVDAILNNDASPVPLKEALINQIIISGIVESAKEQREIFAADHCAVLQKL